MYSIPYGRQWIDEDDIASVTKVLKSDWLTQGPLVEEFERNIGRYCGARHAVAFSSGTAALHGAVFAAGVGAGNEIITSPMSFAASANCAVYENALPRFADIEKDGFNIDVQDLAARITGRTRALIPVDYAGHPAELSEINELGRKHGIPVIQDAAHSLGAEYRGRKIGAQSDLTVFSFHPVKLITTAEGGMVLTNRTDFYERLVRFRTHGIVRRGGDRVAGSDPWYYEMVDLGYNYRISDMQCALGLSQFRKIDSFLARRRRIASLYDQAFGALECLRPLPQKPYVKSGYHLYAVRIEFERLGKSRARVMRELGERGIGSQVHYIPIHLHPFYRQRFGFKPGDFPEAEKLYSEVLTLPMYPKLSDSEVEQVIGAVKEVVV